MYKITLRITWDEIYTLYDDTLDNPISPIIINQPKLTLADNSAGSLEFTVYRNPNGNQSEADSLLSKLQPMKPTLSVFKEGIKKWEGRITGLEDLMYGQKKIYCEGALAYFNDSIQPPSEFSGTPVQFLTQLLNTHNQRVEADRRFTLGTVTVTDPNDYIHRYTNYENTLECINDKLVSDLSGHLYIRYDEANHVRYLDYLKDPLGTTSQTIELGQNLLDYTNSWTIEDLATVVIPLGEMLEESPIDGLYAYLNVSSVNNGSIYVSANADVIANYGKVEKVVHWDDVTEPANLLRKANEYLQSEQFQDMQIDISAVDLHYIDPTIGEIELLDEVRIISSVVGMNAIFPVTKIIIPLQTPEETEYTFGDVRATSYIGSVNQSSISMSNKIDSIYGGLDGNIDATAQSTLQQAQNTATALITAATPGILDAADQNAQGLVNAAINEMSIEGYITIIKEGTTCQEILITNNPDYTKATKVWRWNINGLGYSPNGYNGPYLSAMTMDGAIVADRITAGTMSADRIKGGILSVGGANNQNGRIQLYDNSNKLVLTLDINGLNVNKGVISGPLIKAGGKDNQNGAIQIFDNNGSLVGTWDRDGILVGKGLIKGPKIVAGGSSNINGVIQVLDSTGVISGEWNNAGINLKGVFESEYINPTSGTVQKVRIRSAQVSWYHGSSHVFNLGTTGNNTTYSENGFGVAFAGKVLYIGSNKSGSADVSDGMTALIKLYNIREGQQSDTTQENEKIVLAAKTIARSHVNLAYSLRFIGGDDFRNDMSQWVNLRRANYDWNDGGTYPALVVERPGGAAVILYVVGSLDVANQINAWSVRGSGEVRGGQFIIPGTSIHDNDSTKSVCLVRGYADMPYFQIRTGAAGAAGLEIVGWLIVRGTKNRVVSTEHYGDRALSAIESPECLFNDYGSAEINEQGLGIVYFDPIFMETIEPGTPYQVFTQRTSQKQVEWVEKYDGYFIAHGEPGATFDWNIVCKQKGYADVRLKEMENMNVDPPTPETESEQ